MDDPFAAYKEMQRRNWSTFAPLEAFTAGPAARLVHYAGIRAGERVLDVACGTGVVGLTAARRGALVSGLDLTPELLTRARENARIAGVEIEFVEGDCESLPFADASFDAVLSQFGHIFAPRSDVALAEMLRVLKRGGTIALATWPPETYIGRTFELVSRYLPPPPGAIPPTRWGERDAIVTWFGNSLRDVTFERATSFAPALSPQHQRLSQESSVGVVTKIVELLRDDPAGLAQFRREYEALGAEYFAENRISLEYLLVRAVKA